MTKRSCHEKFKQTVNLEERTSNKYIFDMENVSKSLSIDDVSQNLNSRRHELLILDGNTNNIHIKVITTLAEICEKFNTKQMLLLKTHRYTNNYIQTIQEKIY